MVSLSTFAWGAEQREVPTLEEHHYLSHLEKVRNRFFSRVYRNFKLDNGLEVLIIRDPRGTTVSAALDVAVGLEQDPKEYPGLAHFLEHMLFLGTEKYPKPGEYRDFVTKHGGSYNAMTHRTHTTYHFTVNPTVFEGTFDRFVQTFVGPIFDENNIEKELEAIDSEWQKNINDFTFFLPRLSNLLANPDHPRSRVFQGNKETLRKVPRAVFTEFFKQYYVPQNMKLVLIGPLDIPIVETSVREKFGNLATGPTPVSAPAVLAYLPKDLPRFVQTQAVGDSTQLALSFVVPSHFDYSLSKPHEVLSSLLESREPGSFRRVLEDKGWISRVGGAFNPYELRKASFGNGGNGEGVNYEIIFVIPNGAVSWKKVVSSFFGYINFLKEKGIEQDYFDVLRLNSELQYKFSSDQGEMIKALGEAPFLASRMHDMNASEIFSRTRLFTRYSNETFRNFLDYLDPKKVQIFRFASDVRPQILDPMFRMGYRTDSISESDVNQWIKRKPDPELRLSDEKSVKATMQDYVPRNLQLVGVHDAYPRLIKNDAFQKLWVKGDHSFTVPAANVTFQILTPSTESTRSVHEKALASLYLACVEKSHGFWKGATARANYDVQFSYKSGFQLSFSGFSVSIAKYVRDFITLLPEIDITEKEFQAIRRVEIQKVDDSEGQTVGDLARDRFLRIIDNNTAWPNSMMQELRKITLSEVRDFAKNPFPNGFIRGFGLGSIAPETIEELSNHLISTFTLRPNENFTPKPTGIKFPEGQSYHYSESHIGTENAWLLAYQVGSKTPELLAAIQTANKIMAGPFYTAMRTELGLGYRVQSGALADRASYYQTFLIQSNRPLRLVRSKAEKWIREFVETLDSISASEFGKIKTTLIEMSPKEISGLTLKDETKTLITNLFDQSGDIQWNEKKILALKSLTPADVKRVFQEAIQPEKHKKLTVTLVGAGGKKNSAKFPGDIEITDPEKFIREADRHTVESLNIGESEKTPKDEL